MLWGLYYFVLLAAEKAIGAARLARLPLALRHGLTMLCVTFGWVLFALEDFGELGAYLRTLFTGSLLGAHARVLILSYLPMVLLSVLCCLPLGQRLWARVERKPVGDWAALAGGLALLAVCTAALAAQSYNPFLYFRF